ncbi:DUF2786 domain-containing protein [Terrabacter sp. NPDC080008]|uniref:DUF2786 domain-containing protein n=1 Tax=Terrabacter sp. NPDC080008 TaxID=3155176 RepID=UPI00344EB1EF
MGKASRSRRHGAQARAGRAPAGSAFGGTPRSASTAASGDRGHDSQPQYDPSTDRQARVVLRDLLGQAYAALDRADVHRLDDVVAAVAAMCAAPDTHRIVVLSLLDSLTCAATEAWEAGWQPADVHRLVGRRLGAPEQEIVVRVMADELAQYARATIDRRWLAQLEELDGGSPPPRSVAWLDALRAAGTDWFTLVSRSVTVLHLLSRLPRLEVLTPLPGQALPDSGSAHARPEHAAPPADERILSRVRMLLAKAESTTFEAEAETFTAGAQSLMARHSIDAALLARDSADRSGGAGPQGRRIGIDNPYEGPKAVLLQAVASANRCRMVWSRELGFATVVGFEADLEAVDLLFTSLLVQATRTLAAAGSRTDRHGGSRTRSFRQSFLSAFADRIGERLHEATTHEEEAAVADGTTGRELVPLLAARAEQVDEQLGTWFPEVRQARVTAARDAEGWHHGRSAADRAQLGASPRLRA